jgi:3-dehydroquinate dehydratase-2
MRARIWVLSGPNLNLLGSREPHLYGTATLAEIERGLVEAGARAGAVVECFQSNHEGALVDRVQEARGRADGLIVNFGGYSHTSIALRDALAAVALPAIEVHLTNVHGREPFRHAMMTGGACSGVIAGLGAHGYRLALEALMARLGPSTNDPPDSKGEHRP